MKTMTIEEFRKKLGKVTTTNKGTHVISNVNLVYEVNTVK